MLALSAFHQPQSLEQLIELLRPGRAILAGGTDLCVNPRFLAGVDEVIDIGRCGLSWIRPDGAWLSIGAGTSMRDVAESAAIRRLGGGILAQAAEACASPNIRNVATIGGNCASALPSADTPTALIALDAAAVLRGPSGSRELPLAAFFEGPARNALRNEILLELRLPIDGRAASFQKLGRAEDDIAMVNVATAFRLDGARMLEVRVVAGAVAPVPLRCIATEALLEQQTPSEQLFEAAAVSAMAEIAPISDHRTSAGYRRRMCGVLVRRALHETLERAQP